MDALKENKKKVYIIGSILIIVLLIAATSLIVKLNSKDENTTTTTTKKIGNDTPKDTVVVCKKLNSNNDTFKVYNIIELTVNKNSITTRKTIIKTIFDENSNYAEYKELNKEDSTIKFDDNEMSAIHETLYELFDNADPFAIVINYDEYSNSLKKDGYKCE